jgi:hypothetical protein
MGSHSPLSGITASEAIPIPESQKVLAIGAVVVEQVVHRATVVQPHKCLAGFVLWAGKRKVAD